MDLLPDVSVGDPHAPSHNAERANINELRNLVETGRLSPGALTALFSRLVQWAKVPDSIITGVISRNPDGVITTASVVWPDGATGVFTTGAIGALNTIDSYTITYDGVVDLTFTQPAISRNSLGAAMNVPEMVVT